MQRIEENFSISAIILVLDVIKTKFDAFYDLIINADYSSFKDFRIPQTRGGYNASS